MLGLEDLRSRVPTEIPPFGPRKRADIAVLNATEVMRLVAGDASIL
jgi:hypothetical protein